MRMEGPIGPASIGAELVPKEVFQSELESVSRKVPGDLGEFKD